MIAYIATYLDNDGNPVSPEEQIRREAKEIEDSRQRDLRSKEQNIRRQWISDFANQREIDREWISFAEIIDWRSRKRTDGSIDPQSRLQAIEDLCSELSFGTRFYRNQPSSVLLLNPELLEEISPTLATNPRSMPSSAWVTKDRWKAWQDSPSKDALIEQVLMWCWIPLDVCLSWCSNMPFEPKPEWIKGSEPYVSDHRTGAPGRPSSMHLVEAELKRRISSKAPPPASNLTEEAKSLAVWLKENHPGTPTLSSKGILNSLRNEIRTHVNARK